MLHHSKPTITEEDINAVSKVLASGEVASGRIVEKFENKFSKYIGIKYGVATSSGTDALHLALLTLGIGHGAEVIIPSYVCTSLLNAINYTGAMPCLCDINQDDFNINISDIENRITRRTKAIILPHMFGCPCDIEKAIDLGIPIIEDCAQALGARYNGKMVGSFGVISVFSFYATKLITTGYGGMAVTNSEKLYNKMKDLREYDNRKNYIIRYNYKMSDIQASMVLTQLRRFPAFIARRKEIAEFYTKNLLWYNNNFEFPKSKRGKEHIFYRYIIKTHGRAKEFFKCLYKMGIESKSPVYKPLHQYLGLSNNKFPNTTEAMKSAVSLPIYPSLSNKEVKMVIEAVKRMVLK